VAVTPPDTLLDLLSMASCLIPMMDVYERMLESAHEWFYCDIFYYFILVVVA
jgi:hypothetical protein